MSARREASRPPDIPGYEYTSLLGMGGFADVFLYRQLTPRRQVAVKVLLASSLDDDARARFRTEADLMASLSHHPSIVTIHQSDVAPDGRPYLVMEYCSRPGLGERYRAEKMGVAEVLRIAVRLASAVETAHRAGILHRDIKPANVLITDFGWPALTDFGIAATTGLDASATVGMSIPWSPPELLAAEPYGDARADVYSLAATIYSLLARRSPFEVEGGSNTAADLIQRIERVPLGPTGRDDVPDSLQAVLSRAMAKDPAARPASALDFARALQQVEAGLMLPLTPLDLPTDARPVSPRRTAAQLASHAEGEAAQPTRLRPVRSVSPDPEPADPRRGSTGSWDGTERRAQGVVPPGHPVPVPGPAAGGDPGGQTPAAWVEQVAEDRDVRDGQVLEDAVVGARSPAAPGSAGAETARPASGAPAAPGWDAPDTEAPLPGAEHDDVPELWRRQADEVAASLPPAAQRARRHRRARAVVGAGLLGGLLVSAVAVAAVLAFEEPTRPGLKPAPGSTPTVPVSVVPTPTDLVARPTGDGSVTFTWANPDPLEGDRYLWGAVVVGEETSLAAVDTASVVVVPPAPGQEACIEVSIVRTDGRFSATPAVGCGQP